MKNSTFIITHFSFHCKEEFKKMKTAVIYARYSSQNQTEQSIDGQIRECTEFAERNDIQIINTYVDRAVSGTSAEHRTQFQKMIADSAKQQFQVVLVYKLDRFARNRYDSAIYKSKLKKNGVKVLSAKENITDSPEGIILEGLLEAMDEYYSAELSRKCKRGIREGIIKGHNMGGAVLYGYKRENKHFIIDETTAPAVKLIFEMYASGNYTLSKIAQTLNEQGYRSVNGNPFKRWGVSDILHNDKYTGTHYIDGIAEPEKCPPIIDTELFEKVQGMLQKSASKAREQRTDHVYALTGLVQCGICGQAICGSSSKSNGKHYFYYKCRNRETCENQRNYSADKLEQIVIDALQEYLTQDKINVITERVYKLYTEQEVQPDPRTQLPEINRQIQNVVNAIASGVQSEALTQKLADLEMQREALEKQPIAQPKLTKEHFEYFLKRLATILETTEDKKQLFNAMISSITLFKDELVIAINVLENDNPPTLTEIKKSLDSVGDISLYPCPNCTIVKPNPSRFCDICTAPQRSKAISLM